MTKLQRYSGLLALSVAALEDKSFADSSQTGIAKQRISGWLFLTVLDKHPAFHYSLYDLSSRARHRDLTKTSKVSRVGVYWFQVFYKKENCQLHAERRTGGLKLMREISVCIQNSVLLKCRRVGCSSSECSRRSKALVYSSLMFYHIFFCSLACCESIWQFEHSFTLLVIK